MLWWSKKVNPQFKIYIPSKGRAKIGRTVKALDQMLVPYTVVVEEQEYDEYAKYLRKDNLLILDKRFQEQYQVCDNLKDKLPVGAGAVRNFIWEKSIQDGEKWHWVMDDNIASFLRCQKNRRLKVLDGAFFKAMEDFVLRYKNIAMAGPQYKMFIPEKQAHQRPPFVTNTRIYSCNLIRNDIPFRWRGRYNEDTILSLDILKAGWCTVQFNAFLQEKATTQSMKGGNTDVLYKEGTLKKSHQLVALHPDVARLDLKYGRWHHFVNYKVFKQVLKFKDEYIPKKGMNEYGMSLKKID